MVTAAVVQTTTANVECNKYWVLCPISPVVPILHHLVSRFVQCVHWFNCIAGAMSSKKAKGASQFLPLADILHDLAVLRASGMEISKFLPHGDTQTDPTPVAASVASSHEYTQAARKITRLHDSNKVEREGARIDDLRGKLEDLLEELEATNCE